MLETLGSETMNIKDLSLEEPEKTKFRFDPEKEIDNEMIQDVLQQIENDKEKFASIYRNSDEYNQDLFNAASEAACLLVSLKVLLADRPTELKLDDDTLKFLSITRKHDQSVEGRLDDYADMTRMANLRLLYPDYVVSTKEYQFLKRRYLDILKYSQSLGHDLIYHEAYLSRLLMFDIPNELFSEGVWRNKIHDIEEKKNQKKWREFISSLSTIKVIKPEIFSQIQLTDEDWKGIMDYYSSDDNDSGTEFDRSRFIEWKLGTALDLAIISADEVVINEEGMHLINKTPHQSLTEPLTPPLPEQRSF